jgi:hypothetical protein
VGLISYNRQASNPSAKPSMTWHGRTDVHYTRVLLFRGKEFGKCSFESNSLYLHVRAVVGSEIFGLNVKMNKIYQVLLISTLLFRYLNAGMPATKMSNFLFVKSNSGLENILRPLAVSRIQ